MALRFTHRISAIFSHSLKVSGIQCNKPTLPFFCITHKCTCILYTCIHPNDSAHTLAWAEDVHSTLQCMTLARQKNMHSCADTSGDTRFLPAVQFPSLTLNQSFLIYQRGFVSRRLMPTPVRGKKKKNTTQQQWKSHSKSLLWCDYNTQPNQGWLE